MTRAEKPVRRQLNLRLLEIFAAVVHSNGMTGAATTLNLTQSAVSQAVANLERSVGAKLIDRGKRPLRLTMLGEIMYRHSVDIIDRVNSLDRMVELHLHNVLPMLRLGVVNTVAGTVGPHIARTLDKLAAQWVIWSGYAETSVNSLVERKVDFIITSEYPPADDEFISIPIFEEPYLLVVPAKLAETRPTVESLSTTSPFIRYGSHTMIGTAVDTYLRRNGMVLSNRYMLDTSDAVVAMIEEGMGWTITTPLSIIKVRVTSPRLVCLSLPGNAPNRRLSVIARGTENLGVAHQIAESTRQGLIERCLPLLRDMAPEAKFTVDFG